MLKPQDHVLDYVDAYLHGALLPAQAEVVEQHCQECPICQVALQEARKRFEALQELPVVEASERLIEAAQERITQHQGRRRRWTRVGWSVAATVILCLGGVHLYYLNLSPTPYDLRVLGQTELIANSQASLRVLLVDASDGHALSNVPVDIELSGPNRDQTLQLVSFTTGTDGSASPQFHLPDWPAGDYELRVRARPAGTVEELAHTVKLKRSWRVMLSTDKPVYQPGQTLRLRSLALRRVDTRPVAGQQVVFTVTDPKGNVIFRQKDVTSEFGLAHTDCPLAHEIIEGSYQVGCQLDDTTSQVTVQVKQYVLPKFGIEVKLDRSYYQPGQILRGSVNAKYFFGKPLAGAKVLVVARTLDVELATLSRREYRCGPDGSVAIELRLPETLVGRQADAADAQVWLDVTVTDSAGQQQTKSVSRTVTTRPIRLEVIPESGTLVRGLTNTIYLLASYADGRPVKARISVSGLSSELQTDELGLAVVELTPTADRIDWTLRATDAQGLAGRRAITLECGRRSDDFLLRTDRVVYESGGTIGLVVLGAGTEPVFFDILQAGQTVLTSSIAMTNGRGEYQFDLPSGLAGTLELCGYRFDSNGYATRKTRIVHVQKPRQLQIRTALDREEYRPGQRAKLTLALTDEKGKPTVGAISLAAVDEAVYAVLEQRPGMEQTFFELDQELLGPVYAIYPWSPGFRHDLKPGVRERFEQALFACAATDRTAIPAAVRSVIDDYQTAMGSTQNVLEILNRRDREMLTGRLQLPEELTSLLRKTNRQYSLSANTFPTKAQNVAACKRSGLETITILWTLALLAVLAYSMLHLVGFSLGSLLLTVILLIVFVSFILPACLCCRSAGRPASVDQLELLRLAFESREAAVDKNAATEMGRIRRDFPETLLWRPELITDEHGRASIDVDLADSITTWRLSASAVTTDGRLGAEQSSIRVFQPFFVDLSLPVALTRNDEVSIPVVVYNYLDRAQTVALTLKEDAWFELLDDADRRVELAAGEVSSCHFRVRVRQVGQHHLQVTARGGDVADAIERAIDVVPDGRRVEQVASGTLGQPAEIELAVSKDMIPGSVSAIVRIYPSSFSQLVEGLDAIFQRPYGCFEQTSSTTYPNVLALQYLRQTKKTAPKIEAKAKQYIHLGYQRLLGFEVPGGGFDWFGRRPANRTLTAYGLMEFKDMASVHDVDPSLIDRTERWLLEQQCPNGSWDPEGHRFAGDPTRGQSDLARLGATAYIAWAVFQGQGRASGSKMSHTRDFLLAHRPEQIDDPYLLALVANALLAIDGPGGGATAPYLTRLEELKCVSDAGRGVWWAQSLPGGTLFHGAGRAGAIETTATATLAMLGSGQHPTTVRGALAWLVEQKDEQGTWHSTQATVLALKALIAGTGKPLAAERPRRITIAMDKKLVRELVVPAGQGDVMQQVDVSSAIASGKHRLVLTDHSGGDAGYQVVFCHHVPASANEAKSQEPLSIVIDYDRASLKVDQSVQATARIVNHLSDTVPMVIVDLPIPGGFAVERSDFERLVRSGTIAKHQLTPRSVIVYLRQLPPGEPLRLSYSLRATMPVKVTAPAGRVYAYYDPGKKGSSLPTLLTVVQDNK